jgi:hypothetical protein
MRNSLLRKFQEDARKRGVTLTDPHLASSKKDRHMIGKGCLWSNDLENAEFWNLNVLMKHVTGRGSEVSLCKKTHINCRQLSQHLKEYVVLRINITRHKNGIQQNLDLVIHRDSFFEDVYFTMIYHLLLASENLEYIFPTFAKEANRTTKDGKYDGKVAKLWKTKFKDLIR